MSEETELMDDLMKAGYALIHRTVIGTKRKDDFDNDSTFITTFVLVKEDGSRDYIACPWPDSETKEQMVLGVCFEVLSSDPPVVGYSFLSEVWMAEYKREETEGWKNRPEPRNDPRKQEAVLCICSDGEKHKFQSWMIERDQDGVCAALSPKEMKDANFKSWIINAVDRSVGLRKLLGKPIPKDLKETSDRMLNLIRKNNL
jgi:hypothetical protein